MGRTALLLFLAVFAWIVPPPSDSVYLVWAVRIGAQVGAILTLIHLLCTANDPSLREKLGANPPRLGRRLPLLWFYAAAASLELVLPILRNSSRLTTRLLCKMVT
jgi:hypothetical protein